MQQLCDRVAIIRDGEIVSIEDVKSLQKNNYKKFRINGAKLNHGRFNIKGVTELKEKENEVSFLYKGDVNIIIKLLGTLNLTNVLVEEPTLEEIFMHYYE